MKTSEKISPMPIVVGSPRSGTTLLRMMLDSHPDIAIPPETGFLSIGKEIQGTGDELRKNFFNTITAYPPDASSWADFKISKEKFKERLQKIEPFNVSDGFRLFYKMYAERFGKTRWGEKTPMYCRHMKDIEDILPETRFINVIRDGRDVAVSLRKQWFSPGYEIETQANFWKDNVLEARRQGEKCRHYMEVRLEDLIAEPEAYLREICKFINIEFSSEMLEYYKRAKGRLEEHEEKVKEDGSVVVSKERRFKQQEATTEPPNKSRLYVWKKELTSDDIGSFEQVAGDLLGELGYELSGEQV